MLIEMADGINFDILCSIGLMSRWIMRLYILENVTWTSQRVWICMFQGKYPIAQRWVSLGCKLENLLFDLTSTRLSVSIIGWTDMYTELKCTFYKKFHPYLSGLQPSWEPEAGKVNGGYDGQVRHCHIVALTPSTLFTRNFSFSISFFIPAFIKDWLDLIRKRSMLTCSSVPSWERSLAGSHSTISHCSPLASAIGPGLTTMLIPITASSSLAVSVMTGTMVENVRMWCQQRAMVWSSKTCARKTHLRLRNGGHGLPFHLQGYSLPHLWWGYMIRVAHFN